MAWYYPSTVGLQWTPPAKPIDQLRVLRHERHRHAAPKGVRDEAARPGGAHPEAGQQSVQEGGLRLRGVEEGGGQDSNRGLAALPVKKKPPEGAAVRMMRCVINSNGNVISPDPPGNCHRIG